MKKHSTTSGLSPKRLAKLWNIGSDADQAQPDMDESSRKTELLRDLLAAALPSPQYKHKSRLACKPDVLSVVNSITDKTIEELVRNPDSDVALLRKIKEYGKKLSDNAGVKSESHAAIVIYYAAIASALVFHDKRITKFSYKDLGDYFHRFDKEKWIPEGLRSLFSRAAEYCRMRRSRS